MFNHLLPPEMELEHYLTTEKHRVRVAEQLRGRRTGSGLRLDLPDHLLVATGSALIYLGERLLARSKAAGSTPLQPAESARPGAR